MDATPHLIEIHFANRGHLLLRKNLTPEQTITLRSDLTREEWTCVQDDVDLQVSHIRAKEITAVLVRPTQTSQELQSLTAMQEVDVGQSSP